jgi:hypothetical protein
LVLAASWLSRGLRKDSRVTPLNNTSTLVYIYIWREREREREIEREREREREREVCGKMLE